MAALTSAGHPCGRSVQADLLHSHVSSFPDLLSPTTPAGSLRASVIPRVGCRARARQTSPVPSRLVADTVAESCSFVIMVDLVLIRCFPPRLAATQLLRVLASTTAAGGRGIPPRKRTLRSSALARSCTPPVLRMTGGVQLRTTNTECNSVTHSASTGYFSRRQWQVSASSGGLTVINCHNSRSRREHCGGSSGSSRARAAAT